MRKISYIIFAATVVFYLYEYILRVFPSVLVTPLMQTFNTNATGIGAISAFYLYGYAPMQLPTGFLLDRFGARKLLTFAALVCGIGAFGFGFSFDFSEAILSRLLMGIGSAFAFLGMVYVSSHHFPLKKTPIFIGIGNALGMMGAVLGQGPFSYAATHFGWRTLVLWIGGFGLLLSIIFYFVLKIEPRKKVKKRESFKTLLRQSKSVFLKWQTWIIALMGMFFYLSISAFGALWCVPFIEKAHNITTGEAGFATSMIFVGLIFGSPLIGVLTQKFAKKMILHVSTLISLIAICIVLYTNNLHPAEISTLLFLVGFFSSAELLKFPLGIALNAPTTKGITVGFINFMAFLGGAIIQSIVGVILVYFWTGQTSNGIPVYDVYSFRMALSVFPLSYVLAFCLSFFIDERKVAPGRYL